MSTCYLLFILFYILFISYHVSYSLFDYGGMLVSGLIDTYVGLVRFCAFINLTVWMVVKLSIVEGINYYLLLINTV